MDSIPLRIPYLSAAEHRVARLSELITWHRPLRVGIAWRGRPDYADDRNRSMRLRDLAPRLVDAPGVQLFSLQKGEGEEELRHSTERKHIVDLAPQLRDFHDTAAAVSLLDLVISVDTSVAHLAGALGRPLWLLLPQAGEWRWLRARTDTPWYPSAHVFRQAHPGDWREVVSRIRARLKRLADAHSG